MDTYCNYTHSACLCPATGTASATTGYDKLNILHHGSMKKKLLLILHGRTYPVPLKVLYSFIVGYPP